MAIKHWSPPQLAALRRLREGFLAGTAGAADYWRAEDDLALYDETFGERIGWKWDAVLGELALRGWRPQGRRLLDWGCGSGIAGRRVLAAWPGFEALTLHDRSRRARAFASEKARAAFPELPIEMGEAVTPDTVLLLSHVVSELGPAQMAALIDVATAAREIIWVEAGTHAESRRLCEARDALVARGFTAVAPCTHTARCGILAPRHERHWCHHFAAPPSEAFQSGRWAEFGRELGIDLRSLPYSFVVLARDAVPATAGFSRVIGEPRESRGFTRVLSCQAEGVEEFMLQKRDVPELFRTLHKGRELPVYRWTIEEGKITDGEALTTRDGTGDGEDLK